MCDSWAEPGAYLSVIDVTDGADIYMGFRPLESCCEPSCAVAVQGKDSVDWVDRPLWPQCEPDRTLEVHCERRHTAADEMV